MSDGDRVRGKLPPPDGGPFCQPFAPSLTGSGTLFTMSPELAAHLDQLAPDERLTMEEFLPGHDEAYILANWNLLVEQTRYIATL